MKNLKDEYKKVLITNLEKDVKIRKLKKELKSKKYISFENNLSIQCIEKLRCISDLEKEDTTFISVVLNELYDVKSLKCKSISGRSKNNEKTVFTPEKKSLLDQIYSERLAHFPAPGVNARKKNLSKIIRNAIDIANRKE